MLRPWKRSSYLVRGASISGRWATTRLPAGSNRNAAAMLLGVSRQEAMALPLLSKIVARPQAFTEPIIFGFAMSYLQTNWRADGGPDEGKEIELALTAQVTGGKRVA